MEIIVSGSQVATASKFLHRCIKDLDPAPLMQVHESAECGRIAYCAGQIDRPAICPCVKGLAKTEYLYPRARKDELNALGLFKGS